MFSEILTSHMQMMQPLIKHSPVWNSCQKDTSYEKHGPEASQNWPECFFGSIVSPETFLEALFA